MKPQYRSLPAASNAINRGAVWLLAVPFLTGALMGQEPAPMLKPPVPLPGGLAGGPVITSLVRGPGVLSLQWFGLNGPYQVVRASTPDSTRWLSVGEPTLRTRQTLPIEAGTGFFRVLTRRPAGSRPEFAGADICFLCHLEAPDDWRRETAHGGAFDALKAINQQDNSACLLCHTTGFRNPSGFANETLTPHLAGVQCESCHGPAADHVASIRDPATRPPVTIASEVCGGCHRSHHDTFGEWQLSGHAQPTADVSASIRQLGEPRMRTCGPCHSGAARVAFLKEIQQPGTPLPAREDAAHFGITCAVCHDPHATEHASLGAQLRNPLHSLQPFSYNPGADLAAQYDPGVQLCGQCHNLRGARWQDTARPPHPSPQYNLLIGQGAYDLGTIVLSGHEDIPNQCVGCHSGAFPTLTQGNPQGYVGHTFEVNLDNCTVCHITRPAVERAIGTTQQQIRSQLEQLRGLLNTWAATRAPAPLQTQYGALAWEYTSPGDLSNPEGNPGLRGPTTAEQAQIPDAIKQARLNLYLVHGDGSLGVHNGAYARFLLTLASNNVHSLLSGP